MKITRLLGHFAAETPPGLRFDGERCLHRHDRFQACAACVQTCPTGAFTNDQSSNCAPPSFAAGACHHCLACLPACPTGAITAEDEAPALLRCVRSLAPSRIALVCGRAKEVELSPPEVDGNIRVRGCLAGLGAGALLLLVAADVEEVIVRNDACAECRWRPLPEQVTRQVAEAQALLQLWGRESAIRLSGPATLTWGKRPLYVADSPPVSRRSLFRFAQPEPTTYPPVPDGRRPFRERLRLMQALQQLPAPEATLEATPEATIAAGRPASADPASSPWARLGFAMVAAGDACNACGACARVCPTGALTLALDDESYRLAFAARACIGCDVCAHVCPAGALSLDRNLDYQLISAGPVEQTLRQGATVRCRRCRAPFPAGSGEPYCALCLFRIQNPFAAARPPRLGSSQAGSEGQAHLPTLRQAMS